MDLFERKAFIFYHHYDFNDPKSFIIEVSLIEIYVMLILQANMNKLSWSINTLCFTDLPIW